VLPLYYKYKNIIKLKNASTKGFGAVPQKLLLHQSCNHKPGWHKFRQNFFHNPGIVETEARINNLRITVLENQVSLLQKEVYEIRFSGKTFVPAIKSNEISKAADPAMLSALRKR
jgi:hypothetical protein